MDVVTALSAIGQAIKITKDLRDIERDLDSATYKAQMAELYGTLADVKMALTDAKENLHEKEQQIKELHANIETLKSGENCPLCEIGRMKVINSRAHADFGFAGVQERTISCQNPNCGHTEMRLFDPEKHGGRS